MASSNRFSRRGPPLALLVLLALAASWLARTEVLAAVHDFLTVVEPLPPLAERELILLRLSTHQVPLLGKEIETLQQVLDAGYRRLLIYYSLPTPAREKFVDCSPLAQGMTPAEFFRRKLEPLGLAANRYHLVLIREPYASEEPFGALSRAVADAGVASITFVTLPLDQRRFALLARRHFGIQAYSFNPTPLKTRGHGWWRSHSGAEAVAGAYLELLWAIWP